MRPFALAGAAAAALLLAGCSYSTDASFLGYRTTTSFSTPGAAPGYYAAPAAPAYTEAPPAYAPASPVYAPPPPVYYAPPPVYYGPAISIGLGRWWGHRGYRRW